MGKPATKLMAVRLPERVDRRLNALAKKTHRSKSFYVRKVIEDHLDDLEDYYLAISRLEDRQPSVSIDDVEHDLDLDD